MIALALVTTLVMTGICLTMVTVLLNGLHAEAERRLRMDLAQASVRDIGRDDPRRHAVERAKFKVLTGEYSYP